MAPGFLIAMPQLNDPNFRRAVILMIEHSDDGSMGLVINRAATLTLEELARGQELQLAAQRNHENVFVGGPVDPHRGFVLHDNPQIDEKHELLPGLFLSLTVDALGPILSAEQGHIRFCLGYAGWGPKQLEKEIADGSWLYTEASAQPVLNAEPAQLWDQTLRQMGVDPAMLLAGGPSKGMN